MSAFRRAGPAHGRLQPGGANVAIRRGAWTLARILIGIARLVAAALALGIVLVVLEASRSNEVVDAALDVARFLAGPLRDVFDLSDRKLEVAVNYGLAAVVYVAVASVIARVLVSARR